MSIGPIKIVITLLALSSGAGLIDIGVLIAANALVTIIM